MHTSETACQHTAASAPAPAPTAAVSFPPPSISSRDFYLGRKPREMERVLLLLFLEA